MSIAKVIEIISESDISWEDAAANAITEASETVRNIKSLYVQDMQVLVENGRIVKYRMNAKITFVLEG